MHSSRETTSAWWLDHTQFAQMELRDSPTTWWQLLPALTTPECITTTLQSLWSRRNWSLALKSSSHSRAIKLFTGSKSTWLIFRKQWIPQSDVSRLLQERDSKFSETKWINLFLKSSLTPESQLKFYRTNSHRKLSEILKAAKEIKS